MPRPPILPIINWKDYFEKGQEYDSWLASGENPDNQRRMEDLRQKLTLPAEVESFLNGLSRPVHVIAIAEDWCGDVVRHVPVLQKLGDASSQVRVRYHARGDDPSIFARYLTNGGEAIPKFVFLSADFVECGNWGPMPDGCREFISRGKACGDVSAARELVSAAYKADEGLQVVARELARLIDIAASTSPDPAQGTWARTKG